MHSKDMLRNICTTFIYIVYSCSALVTFGEAYVGTFLAVGFDFLNFELEFLYGV